MSYTKLRVEETPQSTPAAEMVQPPVEVPAFDMEADRNRWRTVAVQTGERLAYAENQLKDLRQAADDARARFTKYKGRLDSANERVNDLQSQLVARMAEVDTLRAQLAAEQDALKTRIADQDVVKRKVWEYRQSLLEGPLFELFGEYCK